jgi:hypothetical protein|tara:strand:- start:352 stop:579 length:228 start_codon:yes stop_codon:yes gene_type:complete
MRRQHLKKLVLDGYSLEDDKAKELIQELVFEYYYDRNDMDFDTAIDELKGDLILLEQVEHYERCLILKDILDRFE